MTALETEQSHDTPPELMRGFGIEVSEVEEQERLVSREQFAPFAQVCCWSKPQQVWQLLGQQLWWEHCWVFSNSLDPEEPFSRDCQHLAGQDCTWELCTH